MFNPIKNSPFWVKFSEGPKTFPMRLNTHWLAKHLHVDNRFSVCPLDSPIDVNPYGQAFANFPIQHYFYPKRGLVFLPKSILGGDDFCFSPPCSSLHSRSRSLSLCFFFFILKKKKILQNVCPSFGQRN